MLADGLPPGFADEAAFLAYLDKAHLPYDLTTDLALINGTGPKLAGHTGVVLAGQRAVDPAVARRTAPLLCRRTAVISCRSGSTRCGGA